MDVDAKNYLMGKTTRLWCLSHPNKPAMIATPQGNFTITFAPSDKMRGLGPTDIIYLDGGGLGDCVGCDGYVIQASEAPYCPTCARLNREGKAL